MAKIVDGKLVIDRYNPNAKSNRAKIKKIPFDIGQKFWTIVPGGKFDLYEGTITGVNGDERNVYCTNRRTEKSGDWHFKLNRLHILKD